MCGRYSLTQNDARFRKRLGCNEQLTFSPRYNICPGQDALVITANDRPHLVSMRWGLVPSWARDETIGTRLINARSETLTDKPAFQMAFERRRCLVLADGFYEWVKDGSAKQPIRIVLHDHQPFAIAGLWEQRRKPGESDLLTFTIITTESNVLLRSIHSRMPVILEEHDYDKWLDPKLTATRELRPLLRPFASEAMAFYPVNPIVNSPAKDCPACIQPLPLRRPARQPAPGQVVRVHHCEHAYRLPDGLEPGTLVRLLKWRTGYWTVAANDRQWEVSKTNIDPGQDFLVADQWLHESHPLAQQELARLARLTRTGNFERF